MALFFCCYQKRFSFSLKVSFFFSPCLKVFWWEISLVCCLKYPYSCFSFHFCFLLIVGLLIFVLFMAFLFAIISLSLQFFSSNRRINAIFNASVFFLLLFLWHITLSPSFLGCKVLCIVMYFLVLCSICWSSFLVHFKICPKYLTRGTAQVFTPLTRFLLYSLVSSSFLVLQKYSFLFFLFYLHLFDGICFWYSQVLVGFLFSERSDLFWNW